MHALVCCNIRNNTAADPRGAFALDVSLHAQNPGQKRRCVHVRWPRQCCHLVSHFEYMPDGTDGGTDGAVDAEKNAACNAVM